MSKKAKCDNCGKIFDLKKLLPCKDLLQRVEAGCEVPAGDCPECGALAYLVRPKKTLKDRYSGLAREFAGPKRYYE